MERIDSDKCKEKSPNNSSKTSELVEVYDTLSDSTLNLTGAEVSYNINAHIFQREQNITENLKEPNTNKNSAAYSTSHAGNPDSVDTTNLKGGQNNQGLLKDSSVVHETNNFLGNEEGRIKESTSNGKLSVAVVKASRPLCADYKSDSENESIDSEVDSSTASTNSTTDTSSEDECTSDDSCDSEANEKEKTAEGKMLKKELFLFDLPPIEDLKISVPEDACVEFGTITSIVETLVVVESYKGTAALDLDTVLFLDFGKRTLGKVFDILGPVTEPVYTVRFNSQEQMKNLNIEKNLKVYYAPKTQHTTFVFMSEVLKNRGSDASWKDNTEAPLEFQDFSDDEQERLHKNKKVRETERESLGFKEQSKCMKRPHNKVSSSSEFFQTKGFRNPNFYMHRRPNIERNLLSSRPVLPFPRLPSGRPGFFDPVQIPPFPHNGPLHPSFSCSPTPPHVCLPSGLSGPPFPAFGSLPVFNQNQNFQHSFHQPRTQGYLQTFGSWGRPTRPMFRYQLPPPPPPPPPAEQGDHLP